MTWSVDGAKEQHTQTGAGETARKERCDDGVEGWGGKDLRLRGKWTNMGSQPRRRRVPVCHTDRNSNVEGHWGQSILP